jgi:hypothetical protein
LAEDEKTWNDGCKLPAAIKMILKKTFQGEVLENRH